jgi:16S rRNA (uracil1498-N3)-methyltransferase
VALAAAKQSKRSGVPSVGDPAGLSDTLVLLGGYALVLVAWEETPADGCGVRQAILEAGPLPDGARVAIVVGPEGGLTADEVVAFQRMGARMVTIGRTILRAETAAVVATALVVHELGGLGNTP